MAVKRPQFSRHSKGKAKPSLKKRSKSKTNIKKKPTNGLKVLRNFCSNSFKRASPGTNLIVPIQAEWCLFRQKK